MTKRLLFIPLLVLGCILYSCSKNNEAAPPPLSDTPLALAQFDNSNRGIYKGVFVGSSGIIVLDISNTGAITAMLKIDGTVYNFTTTGTLQQNQPTTLNFVSGANSFTFTVAANGANPAISDLIINGHVNPAIIIVKETSASIVKMYEGVYTGSDQGIFNAVIYNNIIKVLIRSTTYSENATAEGSVANNQINANGISSTGSVISGTISGNSTSGTWVNTDGANGSWSGARTY